MVGIFQEYSVGNGIDLSSPQSRHLMEIVWITVGSIKALAYNPPNRVSDNALRALKADIVENGIRTPLSISSDYVLIDGHRRLACAKALGMLQVPVIISYGDVEGDYSSVNTTQKPMSDKDLMWIYVHGGPLSPRIKKRVKLIEGAMGDEGPKEILDNGCGPGVYEMAIRVSRYCGDNSPEYVGRVIRWMIKHKVQFTMRRIIDSGTSASIVAAAIAEDKVLRNSWEIV